MQYILVLDDSAVRLHTFTLKHEDDCVVCASTYAAYLSQLHTKTWDIVYLDHDLGSPKHGESPCGVYGESPDEKPTTYIDGWGNEQQYNGLHAAERIIELPKEQRPRVVIVHSQNPHGGGMMFKILTVNDINVRREPFQ